MKTKTNAPSPTEPEKCSFVFSNAYKAKFPCQRPTGHSGAHSLTVFREDRAAPTEPVSSQEAELLALLDEAARSNAQWWDELPRFLGGQLNVFQKVTIHARKEWCDSVSRELRARLGADSHRVETGTAPEVSLDHPDHPLHWQHEYDKTLQRQRSTAPEVREDAVTALVKAAQGVPDPVDRVWCDSCHTSPLPLTSEMVKTKDGHEYKRDYFKHDVECWYGKLMVALAPFKTGFSTAAGSSSSAESFIKAVEAIPTTNYDYRGNTPQSVEQYKANVLEAIRLAAQK